ncbi:MAG TPA: hypothetical protein EYP99_04920, partial [Candidatus Poseidoniales archaeon]|nr:hypothetical protein [Candidatus Poseidoniales archaeon]
MPLINVSHTNKKPVTSTDLRNIAIGLAAVIAIVILAGQITNSGSVSDSELGESSSANYVTIGTTSIAGDNIVTLAEEVAGFTVTGTTDQLSATVTCVYGGVSETTTSHASTGAFSCDYNDDGGGGAGNMGGVADATITVTASVTVIGTTYTSTSFVTQDTVVPTVTITTTVANTPATGGATQTAAIGLTFTLSESASDFAVADIVAVGCNLGSLSGSGAVYTATCTAASDAAVTINVAASTFTDTAGNPNSIATEYAWSYDTTVPTLSIAMASNNAQAATQATTGNNIVLTITASETVTALVCTIDGEATSMGGSGTGWTSTLTLDGDETPGDTVFSCASFIDAAGNAGVTDTSATSGSVNIDYAVPTLAIVMSTSNSNSALAKSGDTITLTITASEAVTALVCTIDGEATSMGGSGTGWTSALTLDGDETEQSTVFSCASFIDAAGNAGVTDTSATSGAVTVDLTAPTLTIAMASNNAQAATQATTGNNIVLTITASETVTALVCTIDAEATSMGGSGTAWTSTLTLDGDETP